MTNCNKFCDDLPQIKKKFLQEIHNKLSADESNMIYRESFNLLMQTKSLKTCGCLEPEKQKECYAKFQ